MWVHVFTTLDGAIDLQVENSDTITNLKEKLEKLKGYPLGYQKIVLHGEILKDTTKFADLKLKDEFLICLTKMDAKGHKYLKQEDYQKERQEEEAKRLDEEKRNKQKENARKLAEEYKNKPPKPISQSPTTNIQPPNINDIPIDPNALEALTQMGFSTSRAKKALLLNNMIVEHAMEWLLKNGNNPNVDREMTMNEINLVIQNFRGIRGEKKNEEINELDEAIKNNVCTFVVTGPEFATQWWYVCMECGLDGSKGCCESCAQTCHKGHKLIKQQKVGSFFCDCGAGESKHACKCLDYEKFETLKTDKKKKVEDEKINSLSKTIQSQMKINSTPEQSPVKQSSLVFLNVVSRYSQTYYCQVNGYEISGNEFRLHIDVRGDNTNGELQSPLQSRMWDETTSQALIPSNGNWTLADVKFRYKGYLVFDYSKMKKGNNYTFAYGLSGYSKVFLLTL